MVRAWMTDSSSEDQRLPHRLQGSPDVSLETLRELGVLYWKLDADNYEQEGILAKLREERKYNYHDVITVSPDKLPNYEEKLKMFFEEHIHSDEEIRFILEGSGYFDVRDKQDRWIRIELVKGELIIVPAGLYHRFTLDTTNYIKAMRLFQGVPVWTPINRPCDDHPSRVQYLAS